MTLDIRIEPEEFDEAWLTAALEEAGVARGATITDLVFDGFVGTGQMSRNARFRLTWSDDERRPATVIAKFPSDDMPTRAWAFLSGVYANEYTFYSQLASTVQVCTPTCWVARYDADTERSVLVMEDLAHSAPGDQFDGCSIDQVPLVLEQLVGLHAPRWGDPTLAAVTLGSEDPDRFDRLHMFYAAAVGTCLSRLGSGFNDDVVDLVEGFGHVVGRWAMGTATPRTITHGDFRPDNFLFGVAPHGPPLAIVDWQTAAKGCGPSDLAYFLAGTFPPEQRRAMERELVDDYRNQLRARSVNYDEGDCWRDYRWGTLHGVLIAVLATMMAQQTERGDRLFTLMINRHAQHAIDLDALQLVEQSGGGPAC